MPGKDKLSVCLLGYRHAAYAEDCVTAIWAGGHANVEIIALDDGSKDGTVEKLHGIADESPYPVKILEQENSGDIPGNFNRLLENASGDYVLFSAMDDAPMPGALGRMMEIAGSGHHAFVAHTNALTLRPDGRTAYEHFAPALKARIPADLLAVEYEWLHTFYIQGAVFRRDILETIGGFDHGMLGDDIVLRTKVFTWLAANSAPFALIEGPGCIYRRHAGNVSKDPVRQVKLGMQYCDKFWPDRPYPEILRSWTLTALDEAKLWDVMPVFKFGKRGMDLLRDAEVREKIHEREKGKAK